MNSGARSRGRRPQGINGRAHFGSSVQGTLTKSGGRRSGGGEGVDTGHMTIRATRHTDVRHASEIHEDRRSVVHRLRDCVLDMGGSTRGRGCDGGRCRSGMDCDRVWKPA